MTSSSSSSERKEPPLLARNSRILPARAGPTPSRLSSSAAPARFISTGPNLSALKSGPSCSDLAPDSPPEEAPAPPTHGPASEPDTSNAGIGGRRDRSPGASSPKFCTPSDTTPPSIRPAAKRRAPEASLVPPGMNMTRPRIKHRGETQSLSPEGTRPTPSSPPDRAGEDTRLPPHPESGSVWHVSRDS